MNNIDLLEEDRYLLAKKLYLEGSDLEIYDFYIVSNLHLREYCNGSGYDFIVPVFIDSNKWKYNKDIIKSFINDSGILSRYQWMGSSIYDSTSFYMKNSKPMNINSKIREIKINELLYE